jgi:exopolyphosphatase/guanosine-5'-triphosphate,3'-diphosphate pyrophosphatase
MRIAAIDVGSNSVHIIVCRIRPDLSFEVIDREKDMIRLGAGSLARRALAPDAIALAMQTLSKFKRLAESHGVDEIVTAATSAVREADNGGDFLTAARRDVGLHVRVISGTEEARLIHLAAAYAVGIGQRRGVVLDIGGGSTEITLGTSARVETGRSFKLGVLRLTERFAKHDPMSKSDERRLVRQIRRETRSLVTAIRRRGFERVIGTSGTIQALGALAAHARGTAGELRRVTVRASAISRLRERLVRMSLKERLAVPGLDPRRADLAAVGATLLDTLLDDLGASEIMLSDYALREGLVLDYIARNAAHIRSAERYPDVRRRSVMELAERCGYRQPHAQQVARLALGLFDATRRRHALGRREREWLEYASLLHDIGIHISYEGHHKHSYYLIKHGDLRGFDPEEVEIMALVARYHRQGTPKRSHSGYGDLPRDRRQAVKLLGALVRLAEGLERSHSQVIGRVQAHETPTGLRVQLHSRGDAELELWAARRHAAPLAAVFNTEILFEAVPAGPAPDPAARKDGPDHAQHAQHAPQLSRPPVRRRGHRRIRQDHAARAAGEVARGARSQGVRH